MMEQGISRNDVKEVLRDGEIIEEYPNDQPHPSGLFLGKAAEKPLHVVAAIDKGTACCYIITAYEPDSTHFQQDFKTRK